MANEWKGHDADGLLSFAVEIASNADRPAEDYLRAVKAAEMAVVLDPEPNGPHVGALGMSLYRAGQFDRALTELQRREEISKAANEEIPFSIIVFKAMALYRLNRVDEANTALDLAISRKTNESKLITWETEAIGLIRPKKVDDK